MRKALLLVVTLCVMTLAVEVRAYELRLEVPWLSQLDIENGLGTDWSRSMNCGPTALVMSAAYLNSFFPTTIDIKRVDDWLVESGMISDVAQYNLPEPGTGQSELRKAAGKLFGLWKTRFFSTKFWGLDKDTQMRLIAHSLQLNHPVIVGVRSRMDPEGQHHWMVLTGLRDLDGDRRVDEIFVNDPGQDREHYLGKKWYPISSFKSVWWGSLFFMDLDPGKFQDNRPVLPLEPPGFRPPPRFLETENQAGPRTLSGSAKPNPITRP